MSIVLFTLSSINTKKAAPPLRERLLFRTNQLQSVLLHLSEALAAVDRTVFARLEGHLAGLAAACANGVEHLALTTGSVLAGIAACLAALGLVLETTACVELLLTGGPNELFAAIFAYQSLVFVHSGYLLFVYLPAEEFQPTLGVTNELIAKLLGALFICPGQTPESKFILALHHCAAFCGRASGRFPPLWGCSAAVGLSVRRCAPPNWQADCHVPGAKAAC